MKNLPLYELTNGLGNWIVNGILWDPEAKGSVLFEDVAPVNMSYLCP